MDTLLKKSGSASPRRVFRKMLRDMIAAQPLPDYALEEQPGDLIYFSQKQALVERPGVQPPSLRVETLEQGRALAPGADIYALEADWRGMWVRSGAPRLRSPDAAFLGWLRKRAEG